MPIFSPTISEDVTMDQKTNSLRSVAVFCGSSPGRDPAHMKLAQRLGEEIAKRGLRLVYGGGGLGLMGAVARAAHGGGAEVFGVIPEVLKEAEALLPDIKHEIVDDMHARKILMYEEADAFIILPGGIGTLEEAIEVLSWQRLNLHEKPILFLSDTDYWKGLIDVLHHQIAEEFSPQSVARDVLEARTVDGAFAAIFDRLENPVEREPLILRKTSVEDLA